MDKYLVENYALFYSFTLVCGKNRVVGFKI